MPVTVTVNVPVVAPLAAVKVRTLVDVVGFVPKFAVTPDGTLEADRVTLPVNPPVGFTVIVLLPPAPPCVMLTLPGEAERVKLGDDDCCPARALIKPEPFGLPQPVARS